MPTSQHQCAHPRSRPTTSATSDRLLNSIQLTNLSCDSVSIDCLRADLRSNFSKMPATVESYLTARLLAHTM
jgi:hypothetical protein